MLDLSRSNPGEDRQTDEAFPESSRNGKLLRLPIERALVVRMQVQWSPMDGTSNAGSGQFVYERRPIDGQRVQAQSDGEQVPRVDAVGAFQRQLRT